ncbi:MAG: nucleotidyltransferase domain-containing protein [Candidatus Bathyarchaeota archaeon]|nr:nucleotidyltransferase domain-containing protein [Candidatus Bathyarchaeota archaeon]
MAVKPTKNVEFKEVTYKQERWERLRRLRVKARSIMSALEAFHLPSVVHGSVARGDVSSYSDVDVFIPELQNSFLVEMALQKANITVNSRFMVMATPTYAMKAHIEIDEHTMVSFPLMEMRKVEREFYRFGGEANLNQINANVRVAGVDKRLMFIEPTLNGHIESNVVGREEFVAGVLGISVDTVLNRVRTLLKRDLTGRTGVFVKRELLPDETFELALKKLSDANPAVRRRMKK